MFSTFWYICKEKDMDKPSDVEVIQESVVKLGAILCSKLNLLKGVNDEVMEQIEDIRTALEASLESHSEIRQNQTQIQMTQAKYMTEHERMNESVVAILAGLRGSINGLGVQMREIKGLLEKDRSV
jgi:DNA primase large subunit